MYYDVNQWWFLIFKQSLWISYSVVNSYHKVFVEFLITKDVSFYFSNKISGMPQIWLSTFLPHNTHGAYSMFYDGSLNYPATGGPTDYERHQRPAL